MDTADTGTSGHAHGVAGFRAIVVALDLEAGGDRALPVVRSLAELGNVPVELLTVSSPNVATDIDAFELNRRAKANGWSEQVCTIVRGDDPAQAIADHMAERPGALLVLATSAKHPLTARFLGSVSEEVLRQAKQPVLLVGPSVPRDAAIGQPTLVACIDETAVGEVAIPVVAAWTRTFGGAAPWICEVLPAGTAPPPDGNEATHVRRYAAMLADLGVTANWDVLHGGEPDVWLGDFADRVTDAIFVTTSVRWTDGHLHRHSTTRRLVQRSAHPVLVVPPGLQLPSLVVDEDDPQRNPAEVEHLDVDECWRLLRAIRVGRLAVCSDGRPLIFPLNYVVDGTSIVFRTAEGTKLAAVQGAEVAFEIDDYDARAQQASSVILHGRAEEIHDLEDWERTLGLPLFPWDVVPKSHFVRIPAAEVSGRRFRAVYAGPGGQHPRQP